MAKKKKKTRVRIAPVRVVPKPVVRAADAGMARFRGHGKSMEVMRELNAHQTLESVERGTLAEKPPLPSLDPYEQAREAARLAQEGNLKLCRAVEVLREAMELAIMAEVDNTTGQMVTPKQLREILTVGLDEYSRLTHQSWRRNKIVHSRAGDRDLSPESFT